MSFNRNVLKIMTPVVDNNDYKLIIKHNNDEFIAGAFKPI